MEKLSLSDDEDDGNQGAAKSDANFNIGQSHSNALGVPSNSTLLIKEDKDDVKDEDWVHWQESRK